MKAMVEAAENDSKIAARVDLFRMRVPEEFYNIKKDPNCLVNLIDNPEYKDRIEALQTQLVGQMTKTTDPTLNAFNNRKDRAIVNQTMIAAIGHEGVMFGLFTSGVDVWAVAKPRGAAMWQCVPKSNACTIVDTASAVRARMNAVKAPLACEYKMKHVE